MKGNKLTVLGITDNLSGSREIRINKPLKALAEKGLINAKFADIRDLAEIKTDIFEDVDIVYNTWLLPFSTVTMSLWAEKYNFKYIKIYNFFIRYKEHYEKLPKFLKKWYMPNLDESLELMQEELRTWE